LYFVVKSLTQSFSVKSCAAGNTPADGNSLTTRREIARAGIAAKGQMQGHRIWPGPGAPHADRRETTAWALTQQMNKTAFFVSKKVAECSIM